jgi:hypothetical protein
MAREAFMTTPFVDVNPADLQVRVFRSHDGVLGVVLNLAIGLTMHVYDPAMLTRLVEVISRGQDLLAAELSGQDPLPVDTQPGVPATRSVVAAGASVGVA